MNKKTQEALKLAIKEMSIYAMQHFNDWLIDDEDLIKAINACKEALESQEIGDAEIRQMLKDIEYYQKRVEELESQKQEYDINEMIDKITPENLQEPVAWMNDKTPEGIFARHKQGADNFGCTIPLYTHPAQPLGDDEITAIFVRHGLDNVEMAGNHIDVVLLMRDVEQAHGIGVKDADQR